MIANPANVDAKDKMAGAVAGSSGGGFDKCFPPSPRAITKVMTTGIEAIRSYLSPIRVIQSKKSILIPIENRNSTERNK